MAFPDKTISYPFGEMDVQQKASAATIDIVVENQKTLVEVAQLGVAPTLTVVANSDVRKGAELIIKLQSDGTARTATLSTGFIGAAIAGVISKTKYNYFIYNGTSFILISSNQVD